MQTVEVIVNGEKKILEVPVTLETFAEQQGYRLDRIAIERNGEIVPKAAYKDTMLENGDTLEVVSFVGGG